MYVQPFEEMKILGHDFSTAEGVSKSQNVAEDLSCPESRHYGEIPIVPIQKVLRIKSRGLFCLRPDNFAESSFTHDEN